MRNRQEFDLLIHGGTAVTPAKLLPEGAVGIRGTTIAYVGSSSNVPTNARSVVDANGGWITPGLIDLHVHGAGGADVVTRLEAVAEALALHGVTAFLPTLIPQPEMHEEVAKVAAEVVKRQGGAIVLGLHLEGPCLAASQAGCLDARHFFLPTDRRVAAILNAGDGAIRRMTIAAELPDAQDLIRRLLVAGIAPSLGHSAATFEQVRAAVGLGLAQSTHTYNAMAPFHHRELGPVGAVLACDEITAEVIGDGVHVHPAAVELLYRIKGASRLMLASDAVPPAGLQVARARWADEELVVAAGVCWDDGGRLAGSSTLLDGALAVLSAQTSIPIAELVGMASLTPARSLGLDSRKGRLVPGMDADVAVFDRDWRCVATVIGGKLVHS